jgi:Family of unknown function (DUF6502)
MCPVTHSVKSSLLVALRYVLKPLVRMALKNGVLFPEFSMALKQAYLDVASRQNRAARIAVTGEGMFVMTGIAAAEAASILHANVAPSIDVDAELPLPRVLNAWHTDKRFTGPYGVLRDLEFSPSVSMHPGEPKAGDSFTDLVHAYFPEISPKALLDELLRLDLVKDVGNGFYRAMRRSYVPDPLSEDMIRLIAQLGHNFLESLEINARPESKGGKGLVQRFVYADIGLNADALNRFGTHVRARGQVFADEIDDWLSTNQERKENQGRFKTGVGYYHYVVNDDDELEFAKGQSNIGEGK